MNKKTIFILLILITSLILFGCTESGPYSNLSDTDTNSLEIIYQQLDDTGTNPRIYFLIKNDKNQLIDLLTQGNFELFYNNEKIPFTLVSKTTEKLNFGLVIDRSNSMIWDKPYNPLPIEEQPLTHVKNTLNEFVSNLRPDDEAAVIAFAKTSLIITGFTNSKEYLNKKITSITAGPSTAVYDGIYNGLNLTLTQPGRKAIIVLTDGANNSGEFTKKEIIELSKLSKIPIYLIGYSTMENTKYEKELLKEIATSTGGQFFESSEANKINAIYSEIQNELNKQYYITFNLPNDTNISQISLKTTYTSANGEITITKSFN
jgi:VWFA-related protein